MGSAGRFTRSQLCGWVFLLVTMVTSSSVGLSWDREIIIDIPCNYHKKTSNKYSEMTTVWTGKKVVLIVEWSLLQGRI
jgi:hypothetical protein